MKTVIAKRLRDIPLEEAHGGSGSRQLILAGNKEEVSRSLEAFTRGYLEPQGAFDWHSHDEIDEFFVCEAGNGLIKFESGESSKYSRGSIFYVPAGLKHRIEAWGEETSEFYFVRVRS